MKFQANAWRKRYKAREEGKKTCLRNAFEIGIIFGGDGCFVVGSCLGDSGPVGRLDAITATAA